MIRHTTEKNKNRVLSAYDDNAAVLKGYEAHSLLVEEKSKQYIIKKRNSKKSDYIQKARFRKKWKKRKIRFQKLDNKNN